MCPVEVLFQATSGTTFVPCQTACVGRPRRCSAEEGEERRCRERREGGGREVEVGEWPRVVVDGLGRSGVGIVGEKGACSLM